MTRAPYGFMQSTRQWAAFAVLNGEEKIDDEIIICTDDITSEIQRGFNQKFGTCVEYKKCK